MAIKSERDLFDIQKIDQLRHNEILFGSLATFCDCTKTELLRALYTRCHEAEHNLVYSKTIHDVKERVTHFWYYNRKKLEKNKYRDLATPNIDLQKAQNGIYKRLDVVPVSLKSTWGKKWDSPENHAEPHRFNLYLTTMDVQNAYPSVTAARVLENVRGALLKPLSLRFPTLAQGDKEELLRCVVFLTMFNNQLPQWVNTSDKIINIVFAKTDEKVQKYIETQSYFLNARYTRYKDDIAVSFAANDTIAPLITIYRDYKWKIEALFDAREHLYEYEIILDKRKKRESIEQERIEWPKKRGRPRKVKLSKGQLSLVDSVENRPDLFEFHRYYQPLIEEVKKGTLKLADLKRHPNAQIVMSQFLPELKSDLADIDNDFDQKKLDHLLQIRDFLHAIITSWLTFSNIQEWDLYQKFLKWIIARLEILKQKHTFKRKGQEDFQDDMYSAIYQVIGELHKLSIRYYIRPTGHTIEKLSETILDILANEWWYVNYEKTKKRTPSSANLRVITGVAFNEEGERMLHSTKRNEYINIFKLLNQAPTQEKDRLAKDRMYREFIINGRVDVEHIKAKIQWIRWRILHVYGERNPPRELLFRHKQVKERWWDMNGLFQPLEEEYEMLTVYNESDDSAFGKKINEMRFNETAMHYRDYENIPFPKIEDEWAVNEEVE